MMKKDFETGFLIEKPNLRVPFGISPSALEALLEGKLKKISNKYYATQCISLSGLELQIGFHFLDTQWGLRLNEFEVFFEGNEDYEKLFPERQNHLERALGSADIVQETKLKAFKFYKWEIGHTIVEHFLRDRFGLEERISFLNNDCTIEAP
ncbi:MAG: hypothetical protein JWO30_4366 [Fibrobacteres bacterium]|nr:hypothetical protein [Fibrobacterota bacterium]